MGRDEAQCQADAVVDAVKAERAAAAHALFIAAGMSLPSNLAGASFDAAGSPAAIEGTTMSPPGTWPSLPTLPEMPPSFMDDAAAAPLPSYAATLDSDVGMTFDSLLDPSSGGSLSTHEELSGHVDAGSLTDPPTIEGFVIVDPSLVSTAMPGLEIDVDATSFIIAMEDDDVDPHSTDFDE